MVQSFAGVKLKFAIWISLCSRPFKFQCVWDFFIILAFQKHAWFSRQFTNIRATLSVTLPFHLWKNSVVIQQTPLLFTSSIVSNNFENISTVVTPQIKILLILHGDDSLLVLISHFLVWKLLTRHLRFTTEHLCIGDRQTLHILEK